MVGSNIMWYSKLVCQFIMSRNSLVVSCEKSNIVVFNYNFWKFHCAKDLIFLLFQCRFLVEVIVYQMSLLKTDAGTTKSH